MLLHLQPKGSEGAGLMKSFSQFGVGTLYIYGMRYRSCKRIATSVPTLTDIPAMHPCGVPECYGTTPGMWRSLGGSHPTRAGRVWSLARRVTVRWLPLLPGLQASHSGPSGTARGTDEQ